MRKILAILCVLPFLIASPALAQEHKETPTITLSGRGIATLKPDMARLNLSVVSNGNTAKEALQKNSEAMQKVNNVAKNAGIEAKDLSTAQISVNPRYVVENNTSKQRGFEARNVLQIHLSDLNKLGALIDDATIAGANGVDSLTFELSNPSLAKQAAYKAAVEDALLKAKTITESLGVKLGEVQEISEQHESPRPMVRAAPMAMMADASAKRVEVPIEAGEVEHGANVHVVWKLKQ